MPNKDLDEIIDACRVPNVAPARGGPVGDVRPLRASDLPAPAAVDLRAGAPLWIDDEGRVYPAQDAARRVAREVAKRVVENAIGRALGVPNAECPECGGADGFHVPGCGALRPDLCTCGALHLPHDPTLCGARVPNAECSDGEVDRGDPDCAGCRDITPHHRPGCARGASSPCTCPVRHGGYHRPR